MKIYYSLIIVLLLVIAGGVYSSKGKVQTFGNMNSSVVGLNGTTTGTGWDAAYSKQLKVGPGVFVCWNSTDSNAGTLEFYDGTTTGSHTMHATTTIFKVAASATEAGYCPTIAFHWGLLAVWTGVGAASGTPSWE